MGGVGGEASHSVGRGDGGDLVDGDKRHRGEEGAGGGAVAQGGEEAGA